MNLFESNHNSILFLLCQLYVLIILLTANEIIVDQNQSPSDNNICDYINIPPMDIVILMDRSCPITLTQCQYQQERIADTFIQFKEV